MATDSMRFEVTRLNCGGCAGRAQKALAAVPGVTDASVNLANRMATVEGSAGVEEVHQQAHELALLRCDLHHRDRAQSLGLFRELGEKRCWVHALSGTLLSAEGETSEDSVHCDSLQRRFQ